MNSLLSLTGDTKAPCFDCCQVNALIQRDLLVKIWIINAAVLTVGTRSVTTDYLR